ncbi:glycoside hydrolase family 2 TIM barrel-domain containing protein [Propionibacterium cyclohexanicum]|uniref:glycoside hydrolase family 2 TIM barrel-domain containing protein n=1 Tax=Propionibacterium cyclohexanicum TaxID=64702 RepID=UPI000B81B665|nr:glycoside hydrolase family 2 TIM barrel-domain containing protein [Propionibacterium cyclohexanicum]
MWTASAREATARAGIELSGAPGRPVPVHVRIDLDGQTLAEVHTSTTSQSLDLEVRLPAGREITWAPGKPTLLDARIDVGQDALGSYLGVRDIDVGPSGLFLNGAPLRLRQVLEQCYWPDSLYAAPSDSALHAEAELVRALGFNGMRIHQLTPDPRLLYWADRLGLLVFAEIGATHEFTPQACSWLRQEWGASVRANASHPSIICWVPINESWGLPELARSGEQVDFAAELAAWTRRIDPTRPVLSNDGWEHADSDLITIHDYTERAEQLSRRYRPGPLRDLLGARRLTAAHRPLVVGPGQRTTVPVLLDEFGGIRLDLGTDRPGSWGYSRARTASDFRRSVTALVRAADQSVTLSGWCWTQLTDVRQETNGLCDERRHPKLPLAVLRAIFAGQAAGAGSDAHGAAHDDGA